MQRPDYYIARFICIFFIFILTIGSFQAAASASVVFDGNDLVLDSCGYSRRFPNARIPGIGERTRFGEESIENVSLSVVAGFGLGGNSDGPGSEYVVVWCGGGRSQILEDRVNCYDCGQNGMKFNQLKLSLQNGEQCEVEGADACQYLVELPFYVGDNQDRPCRIKVGLAAAVSPGGTFFQWVTDHPKGLCSQALVGSSANPCSNDSAN
jgi:hypothetical protein